MTHKASKYLKTCKCGVKNTFFHKFHCDKKNENMSFFKVVDLQEYMGMAVRKNAQSTVKTTYVIYRMEFVLIVRQDGKTQTATQVWSNSYFFKRYFFFQI